MEMNVARREAQSGYPPLMSVTPAPLAVSKAKAAAAPPATSITKPSDKTFADLATDLESSKPTFSFGKSTTARGRQQNCSIKVIPRPLTCFAGQLDEAVTEEDLHSFCRHKE